MEAGPFGMYIKAAKDGVKTRSTPLANLQPEEVNLEVALDLLSYPKALGRHPESGEVVELRRASSTGKVRVGCGAECAYLPKVTFQRSGTGSTLPHACRSQTLHHENLKYNPKY